MIAVRGVELTEAHSDGWYWSVIMIIYLSDTLVVKAAGCIVGLRTKCPIVTDGRIESVIKRIWTNVCCLVLSERDVHRK